MAWRQIRELVQDVAYLWKHRSAANKAMDLSARRIQAEESLRAARQQLREAEEAREAAIMSALRRSNEDITMLKDRLTERHKTVMDTLDETDHLAASATAASAPTTLTGKPTDAATDDAADDAAASASTSSACASAATSDSK